MTGTATAGRFAEHLNTKFIFHASEGGAVPLDLAEVTPLAGASGPGGRRPFALTFRGPAAGRLPQGTFRLAHRALGPLDLFLVPVGTDAGRDEIIYEAIVN